MSLFAKLYFSSISALSLVAIQQATEFELLSGLALAMDKVGVTGVLIAAIVLLIKDKEKQRKAFADIVEKIKEEHKKDVEFYRSRLFK